jgi:hypothetical protein
MWPLFFLDLRLDSLLPRSCYTPLLRWPRSLAHGRSLRPNMKGDAMSVTSLEIVGRDLL